MANIKIVQGRGPYPPYFRPNPINDSRTGVSRRTGLTTKLVDRAIDDLFTTGRCVLTENSVSFRESKQAVEELKFRFLRRLELEHKYMFEDETLYLTQENNLSAHDFSIITFCLCKEMRPRPRISMDNNFSLDTNGER